MKKGIVYICIIILWAITCTILFQYNLINWIGIVISFLFAIPTIIYDYILTIKQNKRHLQLKSIYDLNEMRIFLSKVIADENKTNILRQRAGVINSMGLINIQQTINKQIETYKKTIEKASFILFGKNKKSDIINMLSTNLEEFDKEFLKKILKINPSQEEQQIYKIELNNNQLKELYIKSKGKK